MADAGTWVVVPCCQLLHACEDRGLPTDDGRCKPFKNGGIRDTHRSQGPCHLPARDIELLVGLPFAGVTPLLAPQKPRVLMHRDEAHTARSESPGAAPGLCCREKTCALLFLKRRELLFQGFAHCGNASFRAAGNAQAFRFRALSPGCSILPHSLSRLAAAGPDRNGWLTGYFRFSLRSLRFTAICSRRTSVSSSS